MAGGLDVTVEGTHFSMSGAIFLKMGTDTSVTFRRNVIAEDSVVRIVDSSLDQTIPSFEVEGGSTGTKVFQGNVVRKSRIRFDLTGDWLIGGDTAADSNILVGPRAGIDIGRCGPMTIRGNYSHAFGAGWNQVKNLSVFSPEGGQLIAEHNVFIGSDWNTEFDSPGELRYNLFFNPHQHAWIHVYSGTGTRAHHNLLIQTSENQYNTVQGGFNVFEPYDATLPNRPTEIYNNTLDGGSECNPGNAGG